MASTRRPPKGQNPSPGRHTVLEYVTPDIRDLVFYIHVDSKLKHYDIESGEFGAPTYGDAYVGPDGQFPNHKLVHVTTADGNGWVKWYYAADRANESIYNFSQRDPSAAQGGFPSYTRTYVIRRDDVGDYYPSVEAPQNGQIVTTVGTGVLTGVTGELFVASGTANGKVAYASFSNPTYTLEWGGSFWILFFGVLGANDSAQSSPVDVATPDLATGWISQDDLTVQSVTSDPFLTTIGALSLEPGVADPDLLSNPEWTGYVYTSQSTSRINDKNLDSCYVLLTRTFELLCPRTQHRINEMTGEVEDSIVEIIPIDEIPASPTPVDVDGRGTEYSQLNCDWAAKTTRTVRPYDVLSYDTNMNFFWPPVLSYIDLMDWSTREGAIRIYDRPVFTREAYNGPCRATITLEWFDTQPPLDTIEVMQPLSINYISPLFSLRTGPCLHGDTFGQCDFGNNDPFWGLNYGSRRDFAATNYLDWPDSILANQTVEPGKGGFLKRSVVVFNPIVGTPPYSSLVPPTNNSFSVIATPVTSYVDGSVTLSLSPAFVGGIYQWQKTSVDISGAESSSLFLPDLAGSDTAEYRCNVSTPADPTPIYTAQYQLTVESMFFVDLLASPPELIEGESLDLTVALRETNNASYVWHKDIAGTNEILEWAVTESVVINPASVSDSNTYQCIATNILGEYDSTIATVVVSAIEDVPVTGGGSFGSGGNVTLTADFNDLLLPGATYQWYKDSVKMVTSATILNVTSTSLTITGTVIGDTGDYHCVLNTKERHVGPPPEEFIAYSTVPVNLTIT